MLLSIVFILNVQTFLEKNVLMTSNYVNAKRHGLKATKSGQFILIIGY